MKRSFFLALLVLFGASADATTYSYTMTFSGGAPLGTIYSTSSPQQVTTSILPNSLQGGMILISNASGDVCVDTQNWDAVTVPSSGSTREICVAAGSSLAFSPQDRYPIGTTIYERSNTGSNQTSGSVRFIFW